MIRLEDVVARKNLGFDVLTTIDRPDLLAVARDRRAILGGDDAID